MKWHLADWSEHPNTLDKVCKEKQMKYRNMENRLLKQAFYMFAVSNLRTGCQRSLRNEMLGSDLCKLSLYLLRKRFLTPRRFVLRCSQADRLRNRAYTTEKIHLPLLLLPRKLNSSFRSAMSRYNDSRGLVSVPHVLNFDHVANVIIPTRICTDTCSEAVKRNFFPSKNRKIYMELEIDKELASELLTAKHSGETAIFSFSSVSQSNHHLTGRIICSCG